MIPNKTAWTEFEEAVDETEFTPWAAKGWLAHNGQSPEIAVCDFVSKLVRMMQPQLVIETGVGQGYMSRTIATALDGGTGRLVAFESDDGWRRMIWQQPFWQDRRFVASISPHFTPPVELVSIADLCVIDSDFSVRFDEITIWHRYAKEGAVALIHDTADRDATVHQSMRLFIGDLGMIGVFLNNPRGCFLAVQPKEKEMPVTYTDDSAGPSTRRANGETWNEGGEGSGAAVTSSSQMTKAELVELAKERGLPTSGSKDTLISRLAGVDV